MDANHTRQLALAVIAADPFPMLATTDGAHPRVRPVSPVRTEGFTVWVASMRSSGKTAELDVNPHVELCYLTKDHDQVRITGLSVPVTDRATRQEIWDANPLLQAYLKDIDNPEFMLYRIDPARVRYMKEWALEYQEVPL
jgi:general stress protein 26